MPHRLTKRVAIGLCAAALSVAGCTSPSDAGKATPETSPVSEQTTDGYGPASRTLGSQEFEQVITGSERVVINVHVPYEGEIANTDLMIPFDKIESQAERLPADRGTPLAIYCRSGRMSHAAMQTLTRLGYRDLVELEGGMVAWEQSGRSLILR